MASKEFYLGEEIKHLLSGSYETLLPRVHEAITADRKRLFGVDEHITLLGTFNGYAIVVTESADVYRVKYEISQRNEIVPVGAEPAQVSRMNADQAVRFESKSFVDAFINGSRSLANEHFARLTAIVRDLPLKPEPQQVSEAFETLVRGTRPWKKLFEEKTSEIKKTLETDMPKIEEGRLGEKFRKLYDGSIPESELPGYEALVTSDLKYLGGRIDALTESASRSVERFHGAVPALKKAQTDPTIKMFESFAEDYLADLASVKKSLTTSLEHLNRVDAKGKIYDVLANELQRYEVAGRFVENMSRRLSEAATEEG